MQTTHEMLARERKVFALLETMRKHGWDDYDLAAAMGPEHWRTVAQTAGVKPPSAETIRLVLEWLKMEAKP